MVEQALASDTIHHGPKVALRKHAVVGLAFIINLRPSYFGREEFQLMVEQALADTVHHGRKVTLQKLAVVGLGFIIGLRPGSIGPSEKIYEEHEKASQSFFPFLFSD